MEIAARWSKIHAHRKEDDGTRVHVETFVCCMHTSGVTNGLEHSALPAKLKTREKRRRRKRKRKGKGERKEMGTSNKKKRKEKQRKGKKKIRKRKKKQRKILSLFSTRLIFLKVNYYMKKCICFFLILSGGPQLPTN